MHWCSQIVACAQVSDLQEQLQSASSMQSESTTVQSRMTQLEQQNTDLQSQLQAAARAWAEKSRAHKQTLGTAQEIVREAEQVSQVVCHLTKVGIVLRRSSCVQGCA